MRDLRVYIKLVSASARGEAGVYYSRRADGPFYRWRYDEKLGRWRFSRLRSSHHALRTLSLASWQTVPATLQTQLGEHYLE